MAKRTLKSDQRRMIAIVGTIGSNDYVWGIGKNVGEARKAAAPFIRLFKQKGVAYDISGEQARIAAKGGEWIKWPIPSENERKVIVRMTVYDMYRTLAETIESIGDYVSVNPTFFSEEEIALAKCYIETLNKYGIPNRKGTIKKVSHG